MTLYCRVPSGRISVMTAVLLALAGTASVSPARGDSAAGDASPAISSPDTSNSLEEITVTAQRRTQNLQDVPLAVEVISGANAQAMGIVDTSSLNQMVGSLSVTSLGPQNLVYLRGVGGNIAGPNSELSVATYVDGVYVYAGDQTRFPLNSIDQIEVLKGPQGTLFGRNATGGVIQIITRDPTPDPHAEVSAGYGNYGTTTESLYATGKLANTVSANIAAYATNQSSGWGNNLTTDAQTYYEDDVDVRSKILITPNDLLKILGTFSYANQRTWMWSPVDIPGITGVDGVAPNLGRFNTNADYPTYWKSIDYMGSLRVDYDLGFATLTSTTAYDQLRPAEFVTDADYTPVPLVGVIATQDSENGSEEVLLNSHGNSRMSWTVGTNFFWPKPATTPSMKKGWR